MTAKKLSFEEAMEKLEKSVDRLDEEDITLEEALKNYEKGLEYFNICREVLENAEQRIEIYRKQAENE